MTHRILDLVQATSSSTGNGALVLDLAAPAGYRTPAGAGVANGDTFWAQIRNQQSPAEFEIVLCTYSSAGNGSVTRQFVAGVSSSTTGSLVAFSAGTKTVTIVGPAGQLLLGDNNSRVKLPGPLVRPFRTITSGTSTAMVASDYEIRIKKTVSAAHAVTLPPSPVDGQEAVVTDGKGDLDVGLNNITVTAAVGTVNGGQASFVMQAARESVRFRYVAADTDWEIVA